MAGITGEEEVEEEEEGCQRKGQRSEARQHQKMMEEEEEEVVGRGGSWKVGKAEREEGDKGRKEGGTWEVVLVLGGV